MGNMAANSNKCLRRWVSSLSESGVSLENYGEQEMQMLEPRTDDEMQAICGFTWVFAWSKGREWRTGTSRLTRLQGVKYGPDPNK